MDTFQLFSDQLVLLKKKKKLTKNFCRPGHRLITWLGHNCQPYFTHRKWLSYFRAEGGAVSSSSPWLLIIYHLYFMVLLSEKLQGGLTWRPPTPLPGALPASSREAEKDHGLPLTRSFLHHAGLPHYSPQHRLRPTIRGESHAAHTLSILLLNSTNWTSAQGIFCAGNPAAWASGGQTVYPFVVTESCPVTDTDLWHKETIYSFCRGHKNPCNKKAQHYGWYLWVPLPRKLLSFLAIASRGLFPSLATIAKRGYVSACW